MTEDRSRLTIVPCELREANDYVRRFHRHHKPVVAHRFSLAVVDEAGTVRGVAIVGRPKARMLDDGWTLEANRVATDGCPNACSALYGAAWRVVRALGYRRLVTYTLPEEGGASLRGAGWHCVGKAGGGTWDRPNTGRIRQDKHPTTIKHRWEVVADGAKQMVVHWPTTETAQMTFDLFGDEALAAVGREG